MRIKEIKTSLLRVPHHGTYQNAIRRSPESDLTTCFVQIITDSGVEGLAPGRGSRAVQAVIEEFLTPLLIGQDPLETERIWGDMFWRVREAGRKGIALCAISAVDIALWDLKAKLFDVPLYRLLGSYTDSVPIYGSGGWTNLDMEELVAEQVGYVARGMKAVKMKVGKDFGQREREDIQRLAAVREAVGDDVTIYVDANGAYTAKKAICMARAFECYGVGWFEEPVFADDIDGLAAVAQAIDIPVASGEHEYTKYGFRELIARGGADIVMPNAGRVGGVTEWLKIAHLAQAFNLPVAPHALQLVHLHLACALPNLIAVEYLGRFEEVDKVMYTEFPMPKDGMWSPYPDKPGLGLNLDSHAVVKYAI